MKKTLVVLTVLIFAFVAFASSSINVKASPLAIQFNHSSEEDDELIKSKYGIGAEVSYQYDVCEGAYVEGGLSWNTYLLPDERPNFTSLMAFGGVGYAYPLTDSFKAFAHLDLGTDTLIYDGEGSETITIKTGIGFKLLTNADNVELTFGCDGTFGFANKDDVNYVNYRILPFVGADYNF